MGQRSQIYVRYNDKLVVANYYQWNFGTRMISRARYGIEWIKDYYYFAEGICDFIFRDENYMTRLSRVFDVNFDMKDLALSCDIVKEWEEQFHDEPFNDVVFNGQDNNDGQLFIDVQQDKIFYCFRDMYENRIMDAAQYMDWDCSYWDSNAEHNPAYDSEYMSVEEIKTCEANIKAIGEMAELMTEEQLADFISGDYEEKPF